MRKEIIGDCTLYHGNCLDIIPLLDKSIDTILTDPPYGIEDMVGGYGREGRKIMNDRDLGVCHSSLNLIADTFNDIRVLSFYSCRVTQDFLNGIKGLNYFGDIVWDKLVPGMGGNFRYQHENIAIFFNGNPKPIGQGFSIIREIRNAEEHPHQKPVQLMIKLIKISGGNFILDPFMGSGSTGLSCVKTGKKFIGIELDEKYFDIACRRIEEGYRQPDFFVSSPELIKQESFL